MGGVSDFGAVRKPARRCIRDVGVVGVGGVALMWTPANPCRSRWISSEVAIIDPNTQETKRGRYSGYIKTMYWFNASEVGGSVPHSMTKVEREESSNTNRKVELSKGVCFFRDR